MEDPPDHDSKQGNSVVCLHSNCSSLRQPIYLLFGLGFSPPPSPRSLKAIISSLPSLHLHLSLAKPGKLFSFPKPRLSFHERLLRLRRRRIHPFWYYLCYFLSSSLLGFLLLKLIPARNQAADLDLLFTAVSALTSSSMSTVEMESFSNGQLLVMTFLMLVGGEVFTSMLDLLLRTIIVFPDVNEKCLDDSRPTDSSAGDVELGQGTTNAAVSGGGTDSKQHTAVWPVSESPKVADTPTVGISLDRKDPELTSAAKCLGLVVVAYFVSIQFLGFLSVLSYLLLFRSAGDVLFSKRIGLPTFSIFMSVSSFANCGFVPNNEGTMAFKNNSGLLLLLSAIILAGNTLFPPFLRLLLVGYRKFFPGSRGGELDRLLNDGGGKAIRYPHLHSASRSRWLAATVAGFLITQIALFSGMEWRRGGALDGLQGPYRKAVGAWFQSVNTRHSGESVVDVSTVAPAVLVLYLVMMYLPGYTYIFPYADKGTRSISKEGGGKEDMRRKVLRILHLSHISYLAIFVILICITERKSMIEDPINFSAFNILFEVVSAYGNVGFTTGYTCQRRLTPDPSCQSPSYGFVGAWSAQGKLLLVVVMIFGRLKRLIMGGGKAWKLG